MSYVEMHAGDTLPNVVEDLLVGGVPFDTTGMDATFTLRAWSRTTQQPGSTVFTRPAEIVSAGTVLYAWQPGDTDTLDGWYLGRFTLTDTNDATLTLPDGQGRCYIIVRP